MNMTLFMFNDQSFFHHLDCYTYIHLNNYYLIPALNVWIMPTLVAKLFYLVTWLHVSVVILNNLNDASLDTLVLHNLKLHIKIFKQAK